MDEAQIKGFAIRGLLKFVKESGYEGGIARLLTKISPAAAGHFEERILSSVWYPYEAYSALLTTAMNELAAENQDRRALAERLGAFAGRQDAGAVFRVVAAITSLERVVTKSPMFWRRYCNRGDLEVVEVEAGRLVVRLVDFPGIHPAHCRLITGWILGLGEANGAREASVEKTHCVHDGDSRCEYQGRWS